MKPSFHLLHCCFLICKLNNNNTCINNVNDYYSFMLMITIIITNK